MLGERVSGDTAVIGELKHGVFLGIADVLGHGPEAREVAVIIEDYLAAHGAADVGKTMQGLHEALKGTRGAAVGPDGCLLCGVHFLLPNGTRKQG